MQTELAQIISLTSYGNEFLRTGVVPVNYFPGNSIFQFCNRVDFRDHKRKWFSTKLTETISAADPIAWFRNLKTEGCKKICLYYRPSSDTTFGPEYNLAGFSGGAGTWLIETIYDNYSHYWQKRWQVTDREAPDQKIWSVNYGRIVQKARSTHQQIDIDATAAKLTNVLTELIEFCNKKPLENWKDIFEKALTMFSNENPNADYYHHDLIVTKNHSLKAQQLLFAVGESWVFGGMGSWNDMGFDDKEINDQYLELSQRLYDALLQGIIAATNSN